MIITKDEFDIEYVTIENNGHFTCMTKARFDELEAAKQVEKK
jgi:hypothetical protein